MESPRIASRRGATHAHYPGGAEKVPGPGRRVVVRAPTPSGARTAGRVDDLTGHEACALADQERDQVRDVLGLADALHRDLRVGALDEVVEADAHALGGRLGHLGLDEARRDRVGGDAEL